MSGVQQYRIPFSGVGYRYTEQDKAAVLAAMDSITTLTQGEYQKNFENAFSKYINVPYAFATSSCATALELAAILLKLEPGDEIICPAHTYCASIYPFARYGITIKWADIDLETFVISTKTVEPLITKKTKAIIAVHLYGLPVNMIELMELAKLNNILIIEDCAQSIGATINERRVGSFGDISVFSFQSHKNISTLGEGGMLCVKNPEWAKVIPGLRHNGHRPFDAHREYYWKPAMINVDFDYEGIWPNNFCLGEPQCALGIELLKNVDSINSDRRKRFFDFVETMEDFSELIFQTLPKEMLSAHHLLPVRCKDMNLNHNLIERLANIHKVQAIVQYYPLYRYPLFFRSGHGHIGLPNTDLLFDNMLSLPFHHWMSDEDFDYMIRAVQESVHHFTGCRVLQ